MHEVRVATDEGESAAMRRDDHVGDAMRCDDVCQLGFHPVEQARIVEHAAPAIVDPRRLGAPLVEHHAVAREDEQLRIRLAEIEDSQRAAHCTYPAMRTATPALSSMRAAASVRPSSVMIVPMRGSGRETLRA